MLGAPHSASRPLLRHIRERHLALLASIRATIDSGVTVSWFHYPEPYPGLLRPRFVFYQWGEDQSTGFSDRCFLDPPGFHPVEIEAGLSATAPQAAGIVALVKSVNRGLTPEQVENLILKHSTPIGKGILIPDAYEVVAAARNALP